MGKIEICFHRISAIIGHVPDGRRGSSQRFEEDKIDSVSTLGVLRYRRKLNTIAIWGSFVTPIRKVTAFMGGICMIYLD